MSRQRAAPDLFVDEPRSGVLAAFGRIVSAHPSLAGGSVAFAVIFGFVAANALWHQPGSHPAPILKTREIATSAVPAAAAEPAADPARDVAARSVTTFRIERSDETPTASIPVPDVTPAPSQAPVAAKTVADPVLSQVQAILADQGLYSGEIDGLMGPKSAAAIRNWEKTNGYRQTGEATAALLGVMQGTGAAAKPDELASLIEGRIPAPAARPAAAVATDARSGEPVTVAATEAPNKLVQQIQSGLSNIAYADITVDGVAGAQTRAAISAFEKHYRLPVTGEPNETVLKKLLEIGAL